MTSVRPAPEEPGRDESSVFDNVSRWREEQLLAAGYEGYHAFVLSRLHDVDLHLACELLRRGAPEDVAIEILI